MKDIDNYIYEKLKANSKNINEEIKYVISSKTGKKIEVKKYCDRKSTWNNFESFYNQLKHFNLIKYSRLYLCEFKDGEWVADVSHSYDINDYQPNYRYFYSSKNNYYTYKDLITKLDNGYVIALVNVK